MAGTSYEDFAGSGGNDQTAGLQDAINNDPVPREVNPSGTSYEDFAGQQPQPQQSQGMSYEDFAGQSQPETSTVGSFLKSAARATLPTAAGGWAALRGARIGATIGTAVAPELGGTLIGGALGGVAGFIAGAGAAQGAQDKLADAMGVDSAQERTTEATQHPVATAAGALAPAIPVFGIEQGGNLVSHLLSGAAMGGFNLVQQGMEKGVSNIDPTEAAIAGGVGAVIGRGRGGAGGPAGGMPARADGNEAADPGIADKAAAQSSARPITNSAGGASFEHSPAPNVNESTTKTADSMVNSGGAFQSGQGDFPAREGGKDALPEDSGIQTQPQGEQVTNLNPRTAMGPDAEAALQVEQPQPAPEQPPIQPPAQQLQVPPLQRLALGAAGTPPDQRFAGAALQPGELEARQTAARQQAQQLNVSDTINQMNRDGYSAQEIAAKVGMPPEAVRAVRNQAEWGINQPPEVLAARNQNTPYKPPQPQSLSGAAQPNAFNAAPQAAQVAQGKSILGTAMNAFASSVKGFKTVFDPASLTDETRKFEDVVREAQGENNQKSLSYQRTLTNFIKTANQVSDPAQRDEFVRKFQTGQVPATNPLNRVAAAPFAVEKAYQDRLADVDTEGNWQTNFLPKMFGDTVQAKEAARDFALDWKENRTGIPTIGDFMDAGHQLDPKLLRQDGSPDPVMVPRYLNSIRDRFLEGKTIINKALDNGGDAVVFPQQVPGTVPLEGLSRGNVQLFATPEVATMWKNYFDTQFDPSVSDALKTAQKVKNFGVAWSLLGGGYHFVAETTEAMTGDIMRSISQAAAGNMGAAGKKLLNAPLAPIRQARQIATQAEDAYFKYGTKKFDPNDPVHQAVSYLIKSGFSPERISRYTPDVNSASVGFIKGFQDGANALTMNELGAQAMKGPKGAVTSAFQLLGKGMQTIMEPLFNTYIPRLKTGAAVEQMMDYVAANPDKAHLYQQKAKEILKSVDDRLGEMNQSTLFWNKTLNYAANMSMISPRWEVGTVRAGLGGAASAIRNPKSLSITSPDWHPNSAWPLAFGIMTAITGSIYQFLKTGKPPEDATDPFFPRTGGTALNSSKPERAVPPGYLKDVYSWWHGLTGTEGMTRNASTMLYNKLSNVPRAAWDAMANKDWAGKQIYNPSDPLDQKLQQYFHYVTHESLRPIAVQQVGKTAAKGSNISIPEALLGIRAAPKAVEDPLQSEAGIAKANKREREESVKFHKKYGG